MLSLSAVAQNPQQTAKPGDSNIKEVPVTENYSRPATALNYDDPQANPDNKPPAPSCEPEQLVVRVGSDNSGNGQHGIPVSFRNSSSAACTMGPAVTMRLEKSSSAQVQVKQGNEIVNKVVTTYRPVPLETCQNCGAFHFGSSTGQDITVEPDAVVYAIVGFTSLNDMPCADADTLSWISHPGAEAQHVAVTLHVCAPLRFSGIVKSLPDGFLTP